MAVRWGIIGCGDVADRKGGPALYRAANSELVAVMRRDKVKAADFARRHGARRFYTAAENLLSDPEIDAVYVATPPDTHEAYTVAAAKAGKHVICEKPMALTVAAARRMIDACRQAGVQLMIAFYRRFWPAAIEIRQLVESGAIGTPVFARAQHSSFYQPARDPSRRWRTRPDVSGGGYLADIGSHRLDLLVHFLGDPVDVQAMIDTLTFDFAVDDTSALLIRFRSGVRAAGLFNWNIRGHCDQIEIAGTNGRIIATDFDRGELTLLTPDREESFHLPPPEISHLGLVQNFVESVLSGQPNALSGEEGLKTSRIIEAAYLSSKERHAALIE